MLHPGGGGPNLSRTAEQTTRDRAQAQRPRLEPRRRRSRRRRHRRRAAGRPGTGRQGRRERALLALESRWAGRPDRTVSAVARGAAAGRMPEHRTAWGARHAARQLGTAIPQRMRATSPVLPRKTRRWLRRGAPGNGFRVGYPSAELLGGAGAPGVVRTTWSAARASEPEAAALAAQAVDGRRSPRAPLRRYRQPQDPSSGARRYVTAPRSARAPAPSLLRQRQWQLPPGGRHRLRPMWSSGHESWPRQ